MSDIERTPDGRYIIVNGRRWRAADPSIPETLRQELVDELMAARRLVRTHPQSARPRVRDAKVALGERGYRWWETPTVQELDTRIEATMRALLSHRAGSSICPSDVARVVGGDSWRDHMSAVREAAIRLREAGEVVITQRGKPVPRSTFTGPIRIAPAAGVSNDVGQNEQHDE